jgi:hypothetical protein
MMFYLSYLFNSKLNIFLSVTIDFDSFFLCMVNNKKDLCHRRRFYNIHFIY